MRSLLSAARASLYGVLLSFIGLVSIAIFLLTTTPGFYLVIKVANSFLPGQLSVSNIEGRLIDKFSIQQLSYQDNDLTIELNKVKAEWKIHALLHRQLTIKNLEAQQLKITRHSLIKKSKKYWNFAKLPFPIIIQRAAVNELQYNQNGFHQQAKNLYLEASLRTNEWQLPQLAVDLNQINLQVNARGKLQAPYALSAFLKLKTATTQHLALEGQVKLKGDNSLYFWQGFFTKPGKLRFSGSLKNGHELNNYMDWETISWPINATNNLVSPQGKMALTGNLRNLKLDLNTQISHPLNAELKIQAQTIAEEIKAHTIIKLAEGNLESTLKYNLRTTPALEGTIAAQVVNFFSLSNLQLRSQFSGNNKADFKLHSYLTARYFEHPLQAFINYENNKFQSDLKLERNHLEFITTPNYEGKLKAELLEPALIHPALKGLKTSILIQGSFQNAKQGQISLAVHPGSYQLPKSSLIPRLDFIGGELKAQLTPKHLEIGGKLLLDAHKKLALMLELPRFQFSKGASPKQQVMGELSLNIDSLNFLHSLSEELQNADGQLQATLKASGRLRSPHIEGQINLEKGSMELPAWGVNFQDIQLQLKSFATTWEGQGRIHSNGKTLNLQAKGLFSPQVNGLVTIEGDNVPLIQTPEYSLNLSPHLQFQFTPHSMNLSGNILIPKAELKIQNFHKSASLSDDVVFVGHKEARSLPINTDIRVEMGPEVAINVKGLKGFLVGALQLKKVPTTPFTANGELTIREGKYEAYGQDLKIYEGQLIFAGVLETNPGIRVRAIREFNNTAATFSGSNQLFDFNNTNIQTLDFGNKTTVGIEVSGRLNAPKIDLFSRPSTLSQADILSMLLLGRPANQANKASGQFLLAALSSLNLDSSTSGAQLLTQLKQSLGINFSLENTSQFNPQTKQISDKKSVVVGKSISKRLYVSYNVGLSQADTNILTVTYLLNKFFSIQVNASTIANGIDLLYTHSK